MRNIYCKQIRNHKVNTDAFHMKITYMALKEFRKTITNKSNNFLLSNPDLLTRRGTGAEN